MKQIDLGTWNDLEEEVEKLHAFLNSKRTEEYTTISKPLFRGHKSSEWKLETTLERYLNRQVTVEQYNNYLLRIKPAIESYTGIKWELKNDVSLNEEFFNGPPNYDFMAYARHHGFPSPLLDWSQSIYIALFFAFHNASPDERVAIYAFVEFLGQGKAGWVGAPK